MSIFDSLALLPDDPILNLNVDFAADARSNKVNLGVGAYKTAEGNPMVLSCVKKAEALILQKEFDKEYLPIDGLAACVQSLLKLIYGDHSKQLAERKIYGAHTIGGTGALRIGAELLSQHMTKQIFVSNPTWPNHKAIFAAAGLKTDFYPYYDPHTHDIDFTSMCTAIHQMDKGSAIVLHGCCHNPTGIDLSMEQWKELSALIKKKELISFFDLAYQGFDEGIEEDAKAIRFFADEGHELLVANSCSKNFGLYGERVGMLSLVSDNTAAAERAGSQIKSLIRSNYSNPAAHGARIVATILQTEELQREWQREIANMRGRIKEMRKALVAGFLAKSSHCNFSFLCRQKGIFSFCGLNRDQVHRLRQENGIYMPSNGRMNIAGLNWHNLDYVVDAIISVLST